MTSSQDQADAGWDDYQERVLRNEGRLAGLEDLVAETRESDRKLIEQRSDSLAQELERRAEALLELVTARADAVLELSKTERNADLNEHRQRVKALSHKTTLGLALLREVHDTAIRQNFEQSRAADLSLGARIDAEIEKLQQQVVAWRASDREARELQSAEYARRFDVLNHAHERQTEFQNKAVTRELWESEKTAQATRESVLRDQIVALDRALLGMTPIASSDRAHREIVERMDTALESVTKINAAQVQVIKDQITEWRRVSDERFGDLKEYRDNASGRSSGYAALYAWIVAGVGVVVGVVAIANALTGK